MIVRRSTYEAKLAEATDLLKAQRDRIATMQMDHAAFKGDWHALRATTRSLTERLAAADFRIRQLEAERDRQAKELLEIIRGQINPVGIPAAEAQADEELEDREWEAAYRASEAALDGRFDALTHANMNDLAGVLQEAGAPASSIELFTD